MSTRQKHLLTATLVVVTLAAAGSALLRPSLLRSLLARASGRSTIIVEKNVMVPMRDGVRLATDIYRPAVDGDPAPGKFPVILERTPYGKAGRYGTASEWTAAFVEHGCVVVAQDVRGRFDSEGSWWPLRDDVNDGYDTATWIGEQPWSDGKIGTVGTSYPGGTQHALALSNPPYLSAMIPVDAMSNFGRYGIRHNGAFELRWLNWIFNIGLPEGAHPARDPATRQALLAMGAEVQQYARGLPLRRGMTPLKLAPDYEVWLVEAMSHGDYDDFWKNSGADVLAHLADYKDVPVYLVGGWYDSWGSQTANLNYVSLSKSKKGPIHLIMGPWIHGSQTQSHAGEAEFGPDAALDFRAFHLRWFDHWLKGVDNGVDREPPVRLFVMGGGDAHKTPEGRIFVGGHWRNEQEWPLARTVTTPYYLHADGTLSTAKPDRSAPAGPTQYLFDPRYPVPTLGGNISSNGVLMFQGAADQRCRKDFWMCEDERPLSARNDVLVYETPPLDHDVEVTGRLIVKLWASSSTVDTDFTAKLVDVYPPNRDFPAGVDLNVADSIARARYRDSLEHATLMKPGEVYSFTIEMYPTSLVFQRGHRIRLDISSSNFPRFDVNPNTGEPLNNNRRWAVADNAIYHDAEHPSEILLPVIPPAPSGAGAE
ncbi:MAG TPA: CocE/NonD family hydrolase [Terriglobia bacterium]|nr:CocE/NonD family hydrolase [Terriglobia bacterium]